MRSGRGIHGTGLSVRQKRILMTKMKHPILLILQSTKKHPIPLIPQSVWNVTDLTVMQIQVVVASAKHHLSLVATKIRVLMDHVLLVGLIGEWAAIPRQEQPASMNHLLAQTVLEPVLQEHACAASPPQSAAMDKSIPAKPVLPVPRMSPVKGERTAARMKAAYFYAKKSDAATALRMPEKIVSAARRISCAQAERSAAAMMERAEHCAQTQRAATP